jgi:hypothetical protein
MAGVQEQPNQALLQSTVPVRRSCRWAWICRTFLHDLPLKDLIQSLNRMGTFGFGRC